MQWTETIEIDAPVDAVVDAMRDQQRVMAWSAWPDATGFSCSVEGDGTSVGSEIVFRDKHGKVQGRQRITNTEERRIENRLENRGPFDVTMTPQVDFVATPTADGGTLAAIKFDATIPLPPVVRHLVQIPMSRWVRRLHVKDLQQLKQYVETGSTHEVSDDR